jgi:chromate reductase, NAD(P)H dehydrogenase (quinone)
MTRNKRILVFAGSIRQDSLNRKLALAAAEALRGAGAEVTFAELRDYPMPLYDGDLESTGGLPERAKAFKKLVRAHDALVIASPEYNGSFPALVKNTLDWISRPEPGDRRLEVFREKTAAILSTSPGPGGGVRGLHQLRELLEMMGVAVLPGQLTVPKGFEAFDADGRLTRESDRRALEQIAADVAQALRTEDLALA